MSNYELCCDFLHNLQQIGENNLYEPSERGAGYCVSDSGSEEQLELIEDFFIHNDIEWEELPLNEFDMESTALFGIEEQLELVIDSKSEPLFSL